MSMIGIGVEYMTRGLTLRCRVWGQGPFTSSGPPWKSRSKALAPARRLSARLDTRRHDTFKSLFRGTACRLQSCRSLVAAVQIVTMQRLFCVCATRLPEINRQRRALLPPKPTKF
jgi:hypothetical protein